MEWLLMGEILDGNIPYLEPEEKKLIPGILHLLEIQWEQEMDITEGAFEGMDHADAIVRNTARFVDLNRISPILLGNTEFGNLVRNELRMMPRMGSKMMFRKKSQGKRKSKRRSPIRRSRK